MEIILDGGSLAAAAVGVVGLTKVLGALENAINDAFNVKGLTAYRKAVKRFGKELAGDLLSLQLNFGKLKVAFADALAPLAELVVPGINDAVRSLTGFFRDVGLVLDGVFGTGSGSTVEEMNKITASSQNAVEAQRSFSASSSGTVEVQKELADSTENLSRAQRRLASSASSASSAARGSLMRFDELNRLNKAAGGRGSAADTESEIGTLEELNPRLQAIVDKIGALLEPLRNMDFGPLQEAVTRLGEAFGNLGSQIGAMMEWAWFTVLVPFGQWVVETLAPVLTDTLTGAFQLVSTALGPVTEGVQALWVALQPVAEYIGGFLVDTLTTLQGVFQNLSEVISQRGESIVGIFQNIGTVFTALWQGMAPILQLMQGTFLSTFENIGQIVAQVTGFIIDALYALTEFLAGVFTGDWGRAWDGIRLLLKTTVNGVVDLLNAMISRLVSALNTVISAANRLRFTVPDWVPGIGGNTFGVHMNPITAPQIPHLAQGAVLPANQPFLAVVGDQRHGTNIEAPLDTIREAVAGVTADQTGAIAAGFEASIGVQRQILEAVLGIQIGDEVIGMAANRYARRMAVMQGGGVW